MARVPGFPEFVNEYLESGRLRDDEVASARSLERQVRRYWNAHPISIDDSPHDRGSREQFDAIYRRWLLRGTSKREDFLDMCRGQRVLEVGCGIAVDGRFLSENGIDYQAVDLSLMSLKLADEQFSQNGLRRRFANADATSLPFRDETFDVVFSIGVLHHVPDTRAACREVARVLRPGGKLRVMFYNQNSYHYLLVAYAMRPLVWLLLRFSGGERLARLGPRKLRNAYEISRAHGFNKERLLNISTDTSAAGEDNFNPHSSFHTEAELREMFDRFENFVFWKTNLQYFPLPWLRGFIERRSGFFLQMTARKRTAD